jgi:hypothetical protein
MWVRGMGVAENITSANKITPSNIIISDNHISPPNLSPLRGVQGQGSKADSKSKTVGGAMDTLQNPRSTNRPESDRLSDITLCDNPGSFWGFLRKKSRMKKENKNLGSDQLIGGYKSPGRGEKPKRARLADVINKVKMGVGLGKSLKTVK